VTKFRESLFLNEGAANIFVFGAAFRIAPALAKVHLLTGKNMVMATGLICILKVIELESLIDYSPLGAS
jgi:hypothetical protein